MSELKVLTYLGNHVNIVNLLGACTVGGEGSSSSINTKLSSSIRRFSFHTLTLLRMHTCVTYVLTDFLLW